MLINADFTRPASVTPEDYQWIQSPQGGVERVMLDRQGEEKARATSVVRYAPASYFPRHTHPGGEEILVLSGLFSDETGHYPPGSYLRNPIGSDHQPFSEPGAVIFVKLWQMPATEQQPSRVETHDPDLWTAEPGGRRCTLFDAPYEHVQLIERTAGAILEVSHHDGAEILVLAGQFDTANSEQSSEMPSPHYAEGSWIRLPPHAALTLRAGQEGGRIYLKTGHLGTHWVGRS